CFHTDDDGSSVWQDTYGYAILAEEWTAAYERMRRHSPARPVIDPQAGDACSPEHPKETAWPPL
ncbi:MAG: hypothetical protein LBH76_07120, partial [Propionibacteriaceae bacterium]|nr:hypothetical protein [Propionibacteriaceae bacterium]